MLQRLRIGTRLALAFTTVLLLTALAIGVGLFEVASAAEQNRQLLAELPTASVATFITRAE